MTGLELTMRRLGENLNLLMNFKCLFKLGNKVR